VNETTIDKLEFHQIREVLAQNCATGIGKKNALGITPSAKTRLVRQWLRQAREMMDIVDDFGFPPMGGVHDIRQQVRASEFPAPLEPDALAEIAETLAATGHLCRWFAAIGDVAPTLKSLRERIDDLTPIAESISESIDPRGEVLDYASARLASIRDSIASAKTRIRVVFDRILRQGSLSRYLQYHGSTFHNDRMVLPLRSEHRGRIQGIIHRTSDSGSTLFVEPSESVELNNSIVGMRESESKEITRILRELTKRVRANAPAILRTAQAIGVLDLISAKSRYARKRQCICPEINQEGVIDLHEARHPVLLELFEKQAGDKETEQQVVPIDVRLGDDFDVLVVTGPNTGGKTVTLKTVGLMVVMAQCGIPIPVGAGSTLPVFSDIFMDVGDEQSLQQSLSTFSSHLTTILDLLRQAGEDTLVLIDELGSGTDPDEGAAIGQSVVSELLDLKSKAIVTTHLGVLKAIAYTTERVDNAAVEFDPDSLKPTYRVRMGEPGNSNALIIAKRLGMPARMVKKAKEYLADSTRALNDAIAGTLRSRRRAEKARKTAREAAIAAEQSQAEHHRKIEELRRTHEAFEQWTAWVNGLGPRDEVYIKSLRRSGKVVRMQLQKQTALVSAGAMDIEVPLKDIEQPMDESES
jgi:DNA mismatch repair protein MutS2